MTVRTSSRGEREENGRMNGRAEHRIALTGFGSVGASLAGILAGRPDLPMKLTLVGDRGGIAVSPDGLDPEELLAAKSSGSVANHKFGVGAPLTAERLEQSAATVLVEAASTNFEDGQPGWGFVQMAFQIGIDVVLASKGPLVRHWDRLHDLAREQGLRVGYSATHGAPLPVITMGRTGLAGSTISGLRALFNSTTGLLLEHMEQGLTLAEASAAVARDGVAETNPALDIEGWDAAAKCVIVARSLFGGNLELEDVARKGIEGLSTSEVPESGGGWDPD